MLTHLAIRNIVLIERADIDFEQGLCVLTGETGAGKSILLDALGLVLGARGSNALIRAGETQGSVAAEFDISHNEMAQSIMREMELEQTHQLIVRRTLSSDGKSRILVNDTPVMLTALKQLGDALVEIHGQHDQRSLQDAGLHRDVLDNYGALQAMGKKTADAYCQWKADRDALSTLLAALEQVAREQEYLQHMQKELHSLNPQTGEEETLADARNIMMGSEKRHTVISEAIAELNGKGVLQALRNAQKTLSRSALTSGYTAVIEGLEKASIEAEEAIYALEKLGEETTFNPQKLEAIEERLFALKAAARKYQVPADELPQLLVQVDEKLALLATQTRESSRLERQVAASRQAFVTSAQTLSAARQKAAVKLEKSIAKELSPLKMEGTHFRIRLEPLEEVAWAEHGVDKVVFECATNVGKNDKVIAYAPLSKIASGGELSRFMLAMKVALAKVRQPSTLIFDEIDAGTGGAVADAIGKRLALLGEGTQVLVVTHLPQVAARGSQHLRVAKKQSGGSIKTQVELLSRSQREEELARMLAGETITAEARKAAVKLLEQAA